jgi:hypothetical protein
MSVLTQSITDVATDAVNKLSLKGTYTPLKSSGSLDHLEKWDSTPVIGTEFAKGIQLSQLLEGPDSDKLIRDLAILSSSLSQYICIPLSFAYA